MDGVITAVEPQPGRPKRYNVYVDGELAFSVHEDVVVRLRLVKGRRLDPAACQAVLAEEEENRVLQRALRFLAVRARAEAEVRAYLLRCGYAAERIDAVLGRLREAGWLDDAAFARQWVEARRVSRPRGRRLLRQELLQRGVAAETVDAALAAWTEEDEREAAYALARRRLPRYRTPTGLDAAKLYRFLIGKGFAPGIAGDVVRRLAEEENA
ncbi:RecX family transcriptional regulator [Calditerricola satsumensis]|uniref:Regulatory protein RecX n=1 Tax=Calditerricola satsumensis TaxID=373054 RepID=A0A8J3FAY0_9BACI|nr:RecX family transcriptional regulator [Calditerricola satsumensis]GGK02598.1 hypothetical protein GCM10007043_15870 [Calditerricola satsumensis]